VTVILTSLLGLLQGFRHAFEPDHLAAVTTLASDERSRHSGAWLGAIWGLGHATTLFVVGGTLAALGRSLSPRMSQGFELAVAAMLVGLGARAVRKAVLQGRHAHAPGHVAAGHDHLRSVAHVHVHGYAMATRPLLVGLVHGLAGSGAITAAVLAELPDTSSRLGAIACFGFGSILGMSALSGVLGVPLLKLRARPRIAARLLLGIGLTSALLGIGWGVAAARALGAQ
jgi:sulfite exporter TauE/SafE